MLNNKRAFEFLSLLKKNINMLYPISIPNEVNSLSANEILKITEKLEIKTIIKNNIRDINYEIKKDLNKYTLITGSLYLIGKIRKKYL